MQERTMTVLTSAIDFPGLEPGAKDWLRIGDSAAAALRLSPGEVRGVGQGLAVRLAPGDVLDVLLQFASFKHVIKNVPLHDAIACNGNEVVLYLTEDALDFLSGKW